MQLKNLQHCTHAVRLQIPDDAGAHITKGSHVDFWPAAGTNVSVHVVELKDFSQ